MVNTNTIIKRITIIGLVLISLFTLTITSYSFSGLENENLVYLIDNFRVRFKGTIDFQTTSESARLPATIKLNSEVYMSTKYLDAINYEQLKESNYCITKISQEDIRCHVILIYTIQNTKWAYVLVDEEPIYCWICTSNLRFDTLDNNIKYQSLEPSISIIETMVENMYLGYSFVHTNSSSPTTYSDGFGTGDLSSILDDNNGRNPIIIEAPKPFYEVNDIVQFIVSIVTSIIIAILIIYIYTIIWGESPADTAYTLIVNGIIITIAWSIVIGRIVYMLHKNGTVGIADMSFVTTILIIAACIAGIFNIDGIRVGRPILFTISSNILVASSMVLIMTTYSYYVGILNFWNSFLLPIFNTFDSFVHAIAVIVTITITVAIYNRYTFSYTEDRARIRAMVKARYLAIREQLHEDDIQLTNNKIKKSIFSSLYEDGLPTLNDFFCEMRNRMNRIDG